MKFDRTGLSDTLLIELYRDLLLPRMVEEKMLILLRQGKISKWFSGMGQEAISVGLTHALNKHDYILPLHRNLGVFTTRRLPLKRLIAQWLGKPLGYTQGRDRSFHFGSNEDRIIGMISHLGAMLPVANGIALAGQLDQQSLIAAAFSGDGGTSEGDVHEAMNVAAVWKLPVLFVIENNGYGLSTPISEQFVVRRLSQRAKGYGMLGKTIQGNNVLEVYQTVSELAGLMRTDPQPVVLECMTFRMRGHEEASGTKYVPKELFQRWGKKDPVHRFEEFLLKEGILSDDLVDETRQGFKKEIEAAVAEAFAAPMISSDVEQELASVHAVAGNSTSASTPVAASATELRFVDALGEGLKEAMRRHPNLVLMGQDIAEYGGVFKITEGFVEEFGKERVRNTPLCESAIIGTGMGLSLRGKKAMVEMQFADFVSCGFNQIVNNLAKTHYRWGHAPDVVVRMPAGGGMGAGPFHSQSNEGWFTQVPGLKVVYPAFPSDAKGLLIASFEDPNPVIFFEHKGLYRSIREEVSDGYYSQELGKAKCVREGEDLSIITYGMGVHWALKVLENLKESVEIIDLRSLIPWDQEGVFESVRKTGKCLVLYEATYTGAFGAEIASRVAEECFEYLDGPIVRVGSLDTPVPFHPNLEQHFLPHLRLEEKVRSLLEY